MSPHACTVEWRLPPGISFIDHLPGGEATVYLFEVACVSKMAKNTEDREAIIYKYKECGDIQQAQCFGQSVEFARPALMPQRMWILQKHDSGGNCRNAYEAFAAFSDVVIYHQ